GRHAVLAPGGRVGAGPFHGHLLLVRGTARPDPADPLLLLDLLELLADLAAGIDRPVAQEVELDRRLLGQRQALPLLLVAVIQDPGAVRANETAQVLLDGVELTALVLTSDVVELRHDAYLCRRTAPCFPRGSRPDPIVPPEPTAVPSAPRDSPCG